MPKARNTDKNSKSAPKAKPGKSVSRATNKVAASKSCKPQPKAPNKTNDKAVGEAPGSAISRGCQLDVVFRLMSGEWTPHILWVLSNNGPTRHGELRRRVEGISSKVMTDRLRMLEAEGIVFRHYEPTIPPEVTYGLTELGAELDQALRSMENIAEHWQTSP